jgi:NTP pyrophosphatase (non-canonical NTP hydrolase)
MPRKDIMSREENIDRQARYLASKQQTGHCPDFSDLLSLGREIVAINKANGWDCAKPEEWEDAYKVPALLALITSEVSEALEGFRRDDQENFIEEMADVVIRVLDCTTGLGMDIQAAITAKLEKNRKRGYRHGGKKV